MFRHALLALALVSVAGCALQTQDQSEEGTAKKGLEMTESYSQLTGRFVAAAGEVVTLDAKMVGEHRFEIVVRLNGMVITEVADGEAGVIEFDGFSTATGEDTQMGDPDRRLLLELTQELSQLGPNVGRMVDATRRFVGMWAEYPDTLPLQGIKLAEANRSWTSLCAYEGTYYRASHDCQYGGWWTDSTTLGNDTPGGGYLSLHGDLGGQDGTRFWIPAAGTYTICVNSGVSCDDQSKYFGYTGWNNAEEISHDTRIEYAYGNCFGVCGAGCDGSDFTVDCQNHDQCVRNGHYTTSGYCDDQFAACTDDALPTWLGGAPNCH